MSEIDVPVHDLERMAAWGTPEARALLLQALATPQARAVLRFPDLLCAEANVRRVVLCVRMPAEMLAGETRNGKGACDG